MSKHNDDIEKYLKGELTEAQRHALERRALDDPFLADALEGGEQLSADVFVQDVVELNKKIHKAKSSFWIWPLRIAAGLTLIAVSSYIIWKTAETTEATQPIAFEKHEPVVSVPETSEPGVSASEKVAPTVQPSISETKERATAESKTSQSGYSATADAKQLETTSTPIIIQPNERKDLAEVSEDFDQIAEEKPTEKKTFDDKAEEKVAAKPGETRAKKEALAPQTQLPARSALTQQTRIVKGKVTAAEDGEALPGVNVIIKGTTIGTVTNELGQYEILVPDTYPVLQYSYIGLTSTEVTAGSSDEINVAMTLDATQLSEVVISGYGQPSLPYTLTVDLAHPQNGYRLYKQYLQQNVRYPEEAIIKNVEGKVRVEFTVEANGTLTNFKVLKGIGSGCDEELIRLIKDGPTWVPTKKDNAPVQDKARIELRFKLPK
jgi:TonB family protein